MKQSIVISGTAALAVFERGDPGGDRPAIVMVHGWPDSHEVWDPVADRLAEAGNHVVTFDVRGVGGSTAAMEYKPYAIDKMVADIASVIRATSPGRPVHLVGHDWGGVQGWELASDPAHCDLIETFTTVSGPNLDHLGTMFRRAVRRPTLTNLRPALAQSVMSLYTVVISMPWLRTAMWRRGLVSLFRRWLRHSEGIRAEDGYPGPGLAQAAIAAVPLYRENIWRRIARPRPRRAIVPVHQVLATKDRYIHAGALREADAWVDDLTRTEIEAGHWSPRTHPDELAHAITAHLLSHVRTPA